MSKIKSGKTISKPEVIIREGASLFKTRGYPATTMRELAEAVGVEAPSLYNHIGSKSEILQAICFRVANKFTSQLDHVETDKTGAAKKIETVIRFHIQMMLQDFNEVYVANHEWKHLKEPFLSNFLNQRRNYEKRLMTLVETGIRKREFKNTNPYITVLVILSALRGLEFLQRQKKTISVKVLEADMVTQLLKGIVK